MSKLPVAPPSLSQLRNVIANVQVSLSLAAYTKVSTRWRDIDFVSDFSRLYYIMEGEGGLVIDGTAYFPQPGQLFVLPSGLKLSYFTTSDNTFGKYWCHFNAKLGDRDLFRLLGMPAFVDVDDAERLTTLFQELIEQYKSDSVTAGIRQKAVLLELVAYFLERAQTAIGTEKRSAGQQHQRIHQLQDVLQYIENHLHQAISVNELAELAHFHPNYFIRHFHELLGMSPIQYINHRKMEKAKQLLLASADIPVSEAARAVGLELYYFSRLFKKLAGLSPTQYRELFMSND
ncbi:AraC family transcriptional regulator [Paenibacillus koleovorans]|uniref:AraC family transcriptional regulator n=1 Tax=Paenibacillus koleovorans TaxID=121608 RepID=UPI000FDC90FB|nr:AraC family transcriptional regulator [Paenibacillus koleovorans]